VAIWQADTCYDEGRVPIRVPERRQFRNATRRRTIMRVSHVAASGPDLIANEAAEAPRDTILNSREMMIVSVIIILSLTQN
jgi:hypothetical protein